MAVGELIVRRARGWAGVLRNYRLLVDGEERARIGSGRSVRLQVPDGPVAVQARVDWTGSQPWHGVVGDEPTRLLVRHLDLVGGIVRPDDYLEVVPDTDPATPSPRVDVVRRRRHFFWWYGAVIASGLAYLTLIFVFIHRPVVLIVASVLWFSVLCAAIFRLVRFLRRTFNSGGSK